MKNLLKFNVFMLILISIVSCDTFLDPLDENRLDFDFVKSDPASAEGVLLNGYSRIPNHFSFIDVATDDAVTNSIGSSLKAMALGGLNAQFNPTSRWNNYESILWLNRFLEIIEEREIVWSTNEQRNEMFYLRMQGEALALRAIHHYYILQAHAGVGSSGQLLGVPYIKEFILPEGDFNIPRLDFRATVEAIMEDLDAALLLLPFDYSDDASLKDNVAVYQNFDAENYVVVNGSNYDLRMSGRIAKSFKARVAILAASPAFLNDQPYYQMAAEISSEVLNTIGGVSSLMTGGELNDGGLYFLNYGEDNSGEINDSEMIWRSSIESSPTSNIERRIFPPSVNGRGEINPSQNFVDAFPMLNGFPATTANGFNPQNPYNNRDPRLNQYVVVNGSSFGGSDEINTGFGGGIDRLDSIAGFSTTTGYYLKKTLRPDVRFFDDGRVIGKRHYDVYFRYTELFLIFAEAANEVGGPDFQINGISARDVIGAIRRRANPSLIDNYLASITSQDDMRTLIRNERRIELSFEGHRFWDLRRWNSSFLNQTIRGLFFNEQGNYVELPFVEQRSYPSVYMPIPNQDLVRFSNLVQNSPY